MNYYELSTLLKTGLFLEQVTQNCTGGKVHSSCMSSCPETCHSNVQQTCNAQHGNCQAGCVCPSGKVEYNGTCINPVTCPCYHNGKEYGERTKIQKDCNTWYELKFYIIM